jgi:hypothetical protein
MDLAGGGLHTQPPAFGQLKPLFPASLHGPRWPLLPPVAAVGGHAEVVIALGFIMLD